MSLRERHGAILTIQHSSRWRKHHATMVCQFDAFAGYVAEAEQNGTEDYPLYDWTKATIEDPAKKAKYIKSFTLYVDGNEVYAKDNADALESDLQPLLADKLVMRLSKHDTNPATNPQPPRALSQVIDHRHSPIGIHRGDQAL